MHSSAPLFVVSMHVDPCARMCFACDSLRLHAWTTCLVHLHVLCIHGQLCKPKNVLYSNGPWRKQGQGTLHKSEAAMRTIIRMMRIRSIITASADSNKPAPMLLPVALKHDRSSTMNSGTHVQAPIDKLQVVATMARVCQVACCGCFVHTYTKWL